MKGQRMANLCYLHATGKSLLYKKQTRKTKHSNLRDRHRYKKKLILRSGKFYVLINSHGILQ